MRAFFFLLVLVNLLFFAWSRGYLGLENNAPRAGEPLLADQIRIVSNDKPPEEKRPRPERRAPAPPPPAPIPLAPEPPPPPPESSEPSQAQASGEICLALNDVPSGEADTLGRLFTEKLPGFQLTRTEMPGTSSYGILLSPFKTRRDAEARVQELKRLGVSDFFIMENGSNFAISLGLFSRQSAAETSLAALREKGVRAARLIERHRRSTLMRIEFRGPTAQDGQVRQIIEQIMPQVPPTDCQ